MADQKRETAQLKAENASQKEETGRLNALLLLEEYRRKEDTARLTASVLLEEYHRKEEKDNFTTETKRLKALITEEREERKAAVAVLDGTVEQQQAELDQYKKDLRNARNQHDNDMHDISEVCTYRPMFSFSKPTSKFFLSSIL